MKAYGDVFEKENLKKHSTFGIGGVADHLVKPHNENELYNLIKELNGKRVKYYVLGNGSNVIIDDNDFNGVIIKLDYLDDILFEDNVVTVGAGMMLPVFVNKCLEKGLISLAFASMIPGTVGGSVIGNAGCYGHEIMEYVKYIKVMDKAGNIKFLNKDDISFGYRYTSLKDKYIILSVTFILEEGNVEKEREEIKERNEKRKNTQPIEKRNVGSIFRNPDGYAAGKLIENLGLKGYQIGGAKISEKHANFIVNEDNASSEDVIKLINHIKKEVKKEYNIDLVVEPTIIKWNEL